MQVYHHHRVETYPNDESQAKWTLALEAVMSVVITVMIIAGALSTHACSL
jgi:hypothetical protein